MGRRLRPEPDKTRCSLRSADYKGFSIEFAPRKEKRQQDAGGSDNPVIPKPYYTRMAGPRQGKSGRTALGASLGFRESMASGSFGRVPRQEPSSPNWPLGVLEGSEPAQ